MLDNWPRFCLSWNGFQLVQECGKQVQGEVLIQIRIRKICRFDTKLSCTAGFKKYEKYTYVSRRRVSKGLEGGDRRHKESKKKARGPGLQREFRTFNT